MEFSKNVCSYYFKLDSEKTAGRQGLKIKNEIKVLLEVKIDTRNQGPVKVQIQL